jgi:hypothetical protein
MTPSASTSRTYRQRSSQLIAFLFIAAALVLIVSMLRAWSTDASPLFLSILLLGIAGSWALFLRPAVVVDREGVTLRNVVRDVQVPWHLLTDVEARWNVRVFVGERGFTAWAVSSQIDRPKGATGGLFGAGFGGSSALAKLSKEDTAGAPEPGGRKVTSRSVADVIEQTKAEYAAAVAQGEIVPPAEPRVAVRWAASVLAALAVPALGVLVFAFA